MTSENCIACSISSIRVRSWVSHRWIVTAKEDRTISLRYCSRESTRLSASSLVLPARESTNVDRQSTTIGDHWFQQWRATARSGPNPSIESVRSILEQCFSDRWTAKEISFQSPASRRSGFLQFIELRTSGALLRFALLLESTVMHVVERQRLWRCLGKLLQLWQRTEYQFVSRQLQHTHPRQSTTGEDRTVEWCF